MVANCTFNAGSKTQIFPQELQGAATENEEGDRQTKAAVAAGFSQRHSVNNRPKEGERQNDEHVVTFAEEEGRS